MERVEESSNQVQELNPKWNKTRKSMGMGKHEKRLLANRQ